VGEQPFRFYPRVPDLPGDLERFAEQLAARFDVSLHARQISEQAQRLRLGRPVADSTSRRERVVQVTLRFDRPPASDERLAEMESQVKQILVVARELERPLEELGRGRGGVLTDRLVAGGLQVLAC